MKNIIIYGAPAAGKGTVSESLVEKYKYNHISTGQIFRDLNDNDEFSKHIKEIIAKGNLVDDETTTKLLKLHLDKTDKKNILLDGFPRNINQVKLLDTFFENYIIINLNVDEDVAIKRTLGRVSCPKCGKIYNKYNINKKPKVDNICDNCNIALVSRSDDNEEAFKARYSAYINNCESIFNYYKEKNILYTIDSNKTPGEVFKDIESIITKL